MPGTRQEGEGKEHAKKHVLKKEILVNIAVSIAALVFLFILLEIFFRIYLGSNLHYDYTDDMWFLRPDQKGFTYPNQKYATINSEGYRGEVADSSRQTILFLGDSFTFGYSIGDNDTLTENLARDFRQRGVMGYNILNGGVPGYGILQMAEAYNMKFSSYRPGYVVLNFNEADIYRQTASDDPNYMKKEFVRDLIRSSSFISYMKPRLEVFRQLIEGTQEFKQEHYDEFFSKDMERVKEFSEQLKGENVSLIVHVWVYNGSQVPFYDRVYNFTRENNITILPDYYSSVIASYPGDKRELYAEDMHPSEIQTKRLADSMSGDLIRIISG
jgi:hypothetical protein